MIVHRILVFSTVLLLLSPIFSIGIVTPPKPVYNTDAFEFKSQPENVTYSEEGSTDQLIWQFNPGDVPGGTNYQIYVDSILNKTDLVIGNKAFLDVSNFLVGVYNVTFILDEISNFTLTDTITLHILLKEAPQLIDKSSDLIYENGTNAQISWTFSDLSQLNYTILKNGVSTQSNSASSGAPITVDIINPNNSHLNYTIVIDDVFGLRNTSQIFVDVVSNEVPILQISPGNQVLSELDSNFTLSWIFTDYSPDTYNITRNNILVDTGLWISNETIKLNISDSLGVYNYTITVTDHLNNTASDSVLIEVKDLTLPVIDTSINEITVALGETIQLNWTIYDKHTGNYQILRNGSNIQSGSWNNGTMVSISVIESTPITLNYSLIAFDTFQNSQISTIIIHYTGTLDILSPVFLLTPQDRTVKYGSAHLNLEWQASDSHPASYSLYKNGTLVSSGNWDSNLTISYEFIVGEMGIYNMTMVLSDTFDNIQFSQTFITVMRDIEISFTLPDKLVQRQSFDIGINVYFSDSDTLNLLQLANLSNFSVIVTITIEVTYLNGQQEFITQSNSVIIGSSTIISFSGDQTRNIRSIDSILITSNQSPIISALSIQVPESEFPSIDPTGFINWYRLSLYRTPFLTIFLSIIILGLIGGILYWYRRQLYSLFLEIKLYFQKRPVSNQLNELKEIWLIIVKTNDGIPIYENSLVKNLPDSALIAGLSSAISNMLNELSNRNVSGFETLERDDLTLLNHKLENTEATVISARKLSPQFYDRLDAAHRQIDNLNWVKKVTRKNINQKQQVSQIFIQNGIELQYLQTMKFSSTNYYTLVETMAAPRHLLPIIGKLSKEIEEIDDTLTIHKFLELEEAKRIERSVLLSIFKILVDREVLIADN